MAEVFLDTNVLLYSVSTSPDEQGKSRRARELLQTVVWAWSAQVAAEFARASTARRQPKPLTWDQARGWLETWSVFPMLPLDGALVLEAIQVAKRFQITYFDAQIVAAAVRMGYSILYTEDLNHGQDYGGVQVMNPFAATERPLI